MLAYGVVTGVSDSMVAGVDEVDFDVKGRVDLFLVFILLLLLFLTILVSVLVYISLTGVATGILSTCLKPSSYSSHHLIVN